MGRRNVWENPNGAGQDSWGQPATVLETLGAAAKRDGRKVEERTPVATFRGIPKELQNRVRWAADGLGVPGGELARFLLEYGLMEVRSGELVIEARLKEGRRTLYPALSTATLTLALTQSLEYQRGERGKRYTGPHGRPGDDEKITWRGIPKSLVGEIKRLAEGLAVPVGQVVRRLLEHGLEAMEKGKLTIQVYEVAVRKSIY